MTRKHPLALLILIYGFAALWVVVAAFPFIWTTWGSLKVETDFFGHWTKNLRCRYLARVRRVLHLAGL